MQCVIAQPYKQEKKMMSNQVKAYKATFIKKDGEERNMTFVKIPDLPRDFLETKIKGTGKNHPFNGKMELVWEVNNGFRVFNWETVVGETEETFLNKELFLLDKKRQMC